MKTNDGPMVLKLQATCMSAGLTADQALELARNLAAVALLGPVTASEWLELINDALGARQRPRCGSAWLLTPDLRVQVQAALLATAV